MLLEKLHSITFVAKLEKYEDENQENYCHCGS